MSRATINLRVEIDLERWVRLHGDNDYWYAAEIARHVTDELLEAMGLVYPAPSIQSAAVRMQPVGRPKFVDIEASDYIREPSTGGPVSAQ